MNLDEAREYVRMAHEGQVDKLGCPYHEHVWAVSDLLAEYGEEAQLAGLFHDLFEDTDVTADDLRELGVSENVISAVWSVTRGEGESYMNMIHRAAAHPLGRVVKLADNIHNSSRLAALAEIDPQLAARLLQRYSKARDVLCAPRP